MKNKYLIEQYLLTFYVAYFLDSGLVVQHHAEKF
jgi:hypothetical protein